ncbi:MAG: hypothetical protein P1V20_14470 [Verrucomicrobiales bacterium]|nr:hypothetical protein [Verrucomicrobiales bacterium]
MMLAGILAISIIVSEGPKFVAADAPSGAEFTLHRVVGNGEASHPVFSTVSRKGDTLSLVPTFPLSPGETYEARISVDGDVKERFEYRFQESSRPPPKLVRVLPDTGKVPANLLKFYLEFDQPVREGRTIFDQIHIVDEDGRKVYSPWRRQELWSEDGKRLTLWIHPGRIKQGVNLRQQLGPVLVPGKKYELLLDASIQSPEGKKLGKTVRHPFVATADNRSKLDILRWNIKPPVSGEGTLVIETDRALDPFLVERHLRIFHDDEQLDTSVKWSQSQTKFIFSSPQPWQAGSYRMEVDEYLEDLAGNTAVRVFDTDLELPTEEASPLARDFVISKQR